jgi:very-short-patch-repair endonuclease
MLDLADQARLLRLYEDLRLRLLDLSRRNQLLNYRFSARSKRYLQIVDCSLNEVHKALADEERSLPLAALPEPPEVPSDERTEEFRAALDRASETDVEYLTAIAAIETTGRDDEAEISYLEGQLRNRVRDALGMQPRLLRKEINRVEHAKLSCIDPSLELTSANIFNNLKHLQTLKFADELEINMEKISGAARLAEQEMGLSTLFLAFGFLEWYESDSSDKKAYAPLLLLPVRVEAQKVRRKVSYSLAAREGSAETNLSLQKLLEQNFARQLPDFESADDDSAGKIDAYIDQCKIAVDGLKRWQVHRWLVLGHFAFGRFAMYADLKPENWETPISRKLISSILSGVEQAHDANILPRVPEDYLIDEPEIEKIAPFLIQDADASQHSALVDVMKGKNVVIQGPPGTGKSQTITNIIANALAVGKRVLFLSEKRAALEVVQRRLEQSGLGDFCLEIHSDKASPKAVIDSLRARYELGFEASPTNGIRKADSVWADSRAEISQYVQALHSPGADGETPFGLIWKALRARTVHAASTNCFKDVILPSQLLESADRIVACEAELQIYAEMASDFEATFGHCSKSPWASVQLADFPLYDAPRFINAVSALQTANDAVFAIKAQYVHFGDISSRDFVAFADIEKKLGTPPDGDTIVRLSSFDLDDFEQALEIKSRIVSDESKLAGVPELRHEDLSRLSVASVHSRTEASQEFLDQVPSLAYSQAKGTIAGLKTLLDAVEGILPVLELFELRKDTPASQLEALATGLIIIERTPASSRPYISEPLHVKASDVSPILSEWRQIVEAEWMWRKLLAGYSASGRPSVESLQRAAVALRTKGIKRILAALAGSLRAARDFGKKLGLPIDTAVDDFDSLASHVNALNAFESDQSLAELFGHAWNGIDTPIDEIETGLRVRDFIVLTLPQLNNGTAIIGQLLSLKPAAFAKLETIVPACQRIRALSRDLRSLLNDTRANILAEQVRSRIAMLQAFLDVDPDRLLADINASIRDIANADTLLRRIANANSDLSNHVSGIEASLLGADLDKIEVARAATAWVRAVRNSVLTDELKHLLLSRQVAETAAFVRRVAPEWAQIEADRSAAESAVAEFICQPVTNDSVDITTPLPGELLAHAEELHAFIAIRQRRKQLEAIGLSEFLRCADLNLVDPHSLPTLFGAVMTEQRASAARRVPELAASNGKSLQARRQLFADRDIAKIKNDRAHVRAALLSNLPPVGSHDGPRKNWTEMMLISHEFTKSQRFIPVRQLLQRADAAVQALKPCIMMSPLSLAKFVRPRSLHFDLLVIDEASQMRPEDALGGLLRTQQIVVVGDTKQLPPTDFFNRAESSFESRDHESDDDDDIDAESILEACEATFRERRRLRWHYRSRCESLIAFSNGFFYGNSLITVPMPRSESFSIDLVRVNGTYQNRCNPAEASRVAEEAIAFMRHFARVSQEEMPTLGIVAVNIEQRDFIQEELRRLSNDDELVDEYQQKAQAKGEPLFVKNLENVQGDERDYVYISLTYGPKPGEKLVAQNFGPINRRQGHRRLNVLFTRARVRIGLFTSFGSGDVRPTATSSEGVHALRAYLEYVETKGKAAVRSKGGEPDSEFEAEVARRLRSRNYQVEFQVGVSRFRIDIGVRHPDYPEHFLAGIECDGAAYHSSKSARDRDRLREESLRNYKWDILRVWSTDWFDNPDLETAKLTAKLEELRRKPIIENQCYTPLEAVGVLDSAAENVADPDMIEERASDKLQDEGKSSSIGEPDSASLFLGNSGLTEQVAARVLEIFREEIIRPAATHWEAHRSILRPAMIETFLRQRLSDPDDWYKRVPQYLRSGTNPTEKKQYLQAICTIVSRVDMQASVPNS